MTNAPELTPELLHKREKQKQRTTLIVLAVIMVMAGAITMCVGKYHMQLSEVISIIWSKITGQEKDFPIMSVNVVMGLRLPRMLAAVVVGAALSVSGAVYQGIFRNPLVSPDFLGVSSGACIGAAIAILLELSSAYIQGFAFVGGVFAVFLTLMITRMMRNKSNIMLVLSGIIVGALFSSVLAFLKYTADPDTQLATIVYWQMGSLSYVTLKDVFSVIIPMALSLIIVLRLSWSIDIVSLGTKEARALGVDPKKTTYIAIVCATLLTASAVCIAGTISWVGLVLPHFARLLVGPDNTKLIPTSAFIGAIFMVLVDTASRTIATSELPISILTGIIGIPFYVWLLYKQRTNVQ